MIKFRAILQKLPHWCLLCGQQQKSRICRQCHLYIEDRHSIQSNGHRESALNTVAGYCTQCSLPLAEPGVCGQCLRKPPHFDDSLCAFHYQAPIDKLIQQFKFQGKWSSGQWLSEQLIRCLQHHNATADCLLATPLHWQKQWFRGFNQSAFIARQISQALNTPLINSLYRLRSTSPQLGLSRKAREQNLQGSFELRRPLDIYQKHVAIIDDVITTGATANAMAEMLKKAGAKRVSIWAIARTPDTL